jgi:class 3 adenylate cyclase
MGDLTAVMEAAGSKRAVLLGSSEGACMCALFAATHPERTTSLITIGGYAKWVRSDGYPYGTERDVAEKWFVEVENEWGGPIGIDLISPSLVNDEKYRHWMAKLFRSGASRADAIAMLRMGLDIDLRGVLPSISISTLVLQATGDLTNSLESGRDLAQRIPMAKLVEIDSDDHVIWGSGSDAIIQEIQNFLGEENKARVTDRLLTTVLFTDIVDPTQLAASLGDVKWSDLLEGHHAVVRRELEIFRGHEVKTTGDGFHATFDGPARSIQCAVAIRESTRQLGLNLRIGIHTGECEMRGESLEGVAIHIAARVSGLTAGGDILVSRTVKDLVAGSGIEFKDFGTHLLKGIPDEYQRFKVVAA